MNSLWRNHLIELDIDLLELKGFSRSIAELEWLLVVLMLLYYVIIGVTPDHRPAVLSAIAIYSTFVLLFRYSNLFKAESRGRFAIEIQAMVAIITVMVWFTERLESPLLNLYLLVIIVSAITLGKLATMLELGLIISATVLMSYDAHGIIIFSTTFGVQLWLKFLPFLLVGYLTTMLAADLDFTKSFFKRRAETDDLTGLFNKGAFRRAMLVEENRGRRRKREFSIMVIDADNLKSVNDKFGHHAGDELIRTVAATLRSVLREDDIAARYGGDEFVVMLNGIEGELAEGVAERIRAAVNAKELGPRGAHFHTSISIGIATYPNDGIDADAVFERADEALYHSKKMGRNRVTVFTADTTRPTPNGDEPEKLLQDPA